MHTSCEEEKPARVIQGPGEPWEGYMASAKVQGNAGCSDIARLACSTSQVYAILETLPNPNPSGSISEEFYKPVLDHDRTIERVRTFAAIAPQEMQEALDEFVEVLKEAKAKSLDRASEAATCDAIGEAWSRVEHAIPRGMDMSKQFTMCDLVATLEEATEVLIDGDDINSKEWVYPR
jgi:hypothetical protein